MVKKNVLFLLGGLVVIAVVYAAIALTFRQVNGPPIRITHCPSNVSTGPLAGRNFGGLLSQITGLEGKITPAARIDFCECLGKLWRQKQHRSRGRKIVGKMANQILDEYDPYQGRITLKQREQTIDGTINKTRSNFDWEKGAKIEGLNKRKARLWRNIGESWTGKIFLAYSMTELMPTKNGVLNAQVYDFVLRNAGLQYINSIPALYDPLPSFGPYQLTPYVVYEVKGIRHGGSRLNVALGDDRVPHDSMSKLRGEEHDVFALLVALDNLARLIHKLNNREFTVLEREWRNHDAEIAQFIATAHNYPEGAYPSARRWLANGAKSSYIVSCTPKPREYAEKTAANLAALR